jgi:hypothetical protein
LDGFEKPKSSPVDGLNVDRMPRMVLQGPSQLADRGREGRITHDRIRPHCCKQFFFGHQLLRSHGQLIQNLKGFAGEPHNLFAAPKSFVVRV